MSLASGALLGPYEIVAPIGAGGMGEVCQAQQRGGAYGSGELLLFNDGTAAWRQVVPSR